MVTDRDSGATVTVGTFQQLWLIALDPTSLPYRVPLRRPAVRSAPPKTTINATFLAPPKWGPMVSDRRTSCSHVGGPASC